MQLPAPGSRARDHPSPSAYRVPWIPPLSNAVILSLVAQIPMRQLSLHVSALNDLEYSSYTEALHDLIADDQPPSDDYENVSVGAREVRAWLRGRYASMSPADVDAVRSLFAFRNPSSLFVSSDPQTLLPHFGRSGYFQCRSVLRSHASRYPRKRREGCLPDACLYPRCGDSNRSCTAPRPELTLYPT